MLAAYFRNTNSDHLDAIQVVRSAAAQSHFTFGDCVPLRADLSQSQSGNSSLSPITRTHAALLHQPQDRKIEPLPRPRATALADPQLPLVGPAAAFHQVQAHRF